MILPDLAPVSEMTSWIDGGKISAVIDPTQVTFLLPLWMAHQVCELLNGVFHRLCMCTVNLR
jgi:hypothetical protein